MIFCLPVLFIHARHRAGHIERCFNNEFAPRSSPTEIWQQLPKRRNTTDPEPAQLVAGYNLGRQVKGLEARGHDSSDLLKAGPLQRARSVCEDTAMPRWRGKQQSGFNTPCPSTSTIEIFSADSFRLRAYDPAAPT
jgi:hypothetical protein